MDHAAIFPLIAGTYTPLAAYRLPAQWDVTVLAMVWTCALGGVVLKFLYARRFECLGLTLCIVMGLTGLLFGRTLFHALRQSNFELIVAGAVTCLAGIIVLQMNRLFTTQDGTFCSCLQRLSIFCDRARICTAMIARHAALLAARVGSIPYD